ncbi:MAG TPA: translocation/assembly module TamB domain-containing protein [Candidatus Krumholzibacteria bacterium]|nr:translocation/assembly module TamB domain-containing protein [Candidatus Krumholzibacteria bacterium]HPD72443.1 translocation/assembly module TamB domain-containing protein [Candidatus Krumholzibacteria bacterium]HRY40625.1 translocation/assembly module TamB domain-containing protein [Candidatus Krumholzibacteria bacterium]
MDRSRLADRLRRWRHALRVVSSIAAGTVAALLVVLALVVLVPAGRRAVLRAGLETAGRTLPGDLAAARVDWPALGRLQLEGVVWSDGPDTLVRADTLSLALDVSDLRRRDLTIRRLLAAGLAVDPAAIRRRLAPASASAAPARSAPSPERSPLLRVGSLPPLPSIAIEQLTLRRARVATGATGSIRVANASVAVELRRDRPPTFAAAVRGSLLPDVGASWRLAGNLGPDSLTVDLAAVHLDAPPELPEPGGLPLTGRLAVPIAWVRAALSGRLDWPVLDLRGLAITGAYGDGRLDARLEGRAPGRLILDARWRQVPSALLARVRARGAGGVASGLVDSLAARWGRPATPGLVLRVDVTPPPAPAPLAAVGLAAHGDLRLPAPAAVSPLLPPQLRVDDLGPILATLDLRYDGGASPPRYAARVDLGATAWLDAGFIEADGDTASVRLDTLAVALPGLSITGAGAADRDSVLARFRLQVPDGRLLERWRDPRLADLEISLAADLNVAGSWPFPRVEVAAAGAIAAPQIAIPDWSLAAVVAADTLQLALALPAGLRSARQDFVAASLDFAGAAVDTLHDLHGAVRLALRGPRAGVVLAGRLQVEDLPTAPSGSLAGDMLVVDLSGRGLANRGPWRATFSLADSTVSVTGLRLEGYLGELDLALDATPDSLTADLMLALRVAVDAFAAIVPARARAYLPDGTLAVAGGLEVAGPLAAPWAAGELRVSLADNPDLAGLSAESQLTLGGAGSPPAGLAPGRAGWREHSARVDLVLNDADSLLARVSALVPLPRPGAAADSVDIRLVVDGLDLHRLEPFLPGGSAISGRLDAAIRAAGLTPPGEAAGDVDLSGRLGAADLRLRTPDGSWLSMGGSVEFAGTSRAPIVRGGLEIDAGLIRLPDRPPTLLPASGDALLWQSATGRADSLANAAADSLPPPAAGPSFLPDLVFTVFCPGALWLRGNGLDAELEGDLTVRLSGGRPTIEGELDAKQGTLQQLGRVFRLRRGRVIFSADESKLDPELDLSLDTAVSGYLITVTLSGTASRPVLEFTSSPDLGEGDIVSVLLFGKTSSELNEGQANLMAERAGQIATAYGSTRLQEAVGRELGVDVLTIAPREDDSETNALTIGKYLSPKVMVSYEQLMRQESAFLVHLNFSLSANQDWKLHTQVSQGEASGVEIKWEKDW